jgi:hypothetical protein
VTDADLAGFREMDAMRTQARAARSGSAARTARTDLAPATRPWADPHAGHAAQAPFGGGHDLSRIHVSAPAAAAPIQRVRWRWDAHNGQWDDVHGSSSHSTPPTHRGSVHGEVYEDRYSQDEDPTATPYHRSGASSFGESGAELQTRGRKPAAAQIREEAVGGPGRSGGAGLHEIVPTNLRDWVASTGNEALIGSQAGFRTATDYQLFAPAVTATGEVGGHTGAFRKPSGLGSTHTRGQAPAHDTLRAAAQSVEHQADPDVVVNTLALAHLDSTPHGQEILQSDYLTGARPNRLIFGTLGPVAGSGSAPDPNRLALAQDVHARRELVKARERGRSRLRDPARARTRSPSPERTPIDASGGGGGYVAGDRTTWATAPVPAFAETGWRQIANETAWLSQPQRHPFDVSTAPLVRPTPSSGGASSSAPVTLGTPVAASPAPRRGRGRPRKRKQPSATPAAAAAIAPAPAPARQSARSKRQRPSPAVATVPAAASSSTTTAPAPRRRGRGRKRRQPSSTPSASTASAPAPAPIPRARQRRRKRRRKASSG